jgi:hypothetical protein
MESTANVCVGVVPSEGEKKWTPMLGSIHQSAAAGLPSAPKNDGCW